MATFIIRRHPIAILVTAFTKSNKLTNDLISLQMVAYGWHQVAYIMVFTGLILKFTGLEQI